jgi:serine/threonine protein kinase
VVSQNGPWSDKWKVESKLSRGGQGTTWLATLQADSTRQAVLNNQKSEQARARMRREAVALDTLAKSGVKVPAVVDGNTEAYADPAVPLYLVTEFIPGKTLTDEVRQRGRISLDQAAAFALDLCGTVAAAHRDNVLHRDLKPANIVVRNRSPADLVVQRGSRRRPSDGDG